MFFHSPELSFCSGVTVPTNPEFVKIPPLFPVSVVLLFARRQSLPFIFIAAFRFRSVCAPQSTFMSRYQPWKSQHGPAFSCTFTVMLQDGGLTQGCETCLMACECERGGRDNTWKYSLSPLKKKRRDGPVSHTLKTQTENREDELCPLKPDNDEGWEDGAREEDFDAQSLQTTILHVCLHVAHFLFDWSVQHDCFCFVLILIRLLVKRLQ